MKAKNILFLHGWEGSSKEHWFPKARVEFENLGFRIEIPDMPGAYFPKRDEWTQIIKKYHPDGSWILIGHSLGGVAILNYLEIAEESVAQVIFLAIPFEPMKFNPIANFFENGFDWKKIKSKCPKFDILNEDKDPVVPLEHGRKYAEELNGNLHIIKGYSHFHSFDLDILKKIITH